MAKFVCVMTCAVSLLLFALDGTAVLPIYLIEY